MKRCGRDVVVMTPGPSNQSETSFRRDDSPEVEEDEECDEVVKTCREGFQNFFESSRCGATSASKSRSPGRLNRKINVNELKLSEKVETLNPEIVQRNLPKVLRGKEDFDDGSFHRRDSLTLDKLLSNPSNLSCIAPVHFFPHAPLADVWDQLALPGLTIELRNPFIDGTYEYYWLASIVHYAGYRALVRFENFSSEEDSVQYLSWISFCSGTPKYLGWCMDNGKEINAGPIVPKELSVAKFVEKLAQFYVLNLPTLRADHLNVINRSIQSMVTFGLGEKVEAVDKSHPSRCRVGRIVAIVGDRMHVKYLDKLEEMNNDGLWCSARSQMVHPLGWCNAVGVFLLRNSEEKLKYPLREDYGPKYPEKLIIKPGMRLEARHPLFPHKFVGAMVRKVLKFGYFIIETRDESMQMRTKTVVHVTNPYLYPSGWAERWTSHGKVEFSSNYNPSIHENLRLELLPKRSPNNFKAGMKVETVHHREPSMAVCATVLAVADHMLFIRYDSSANDDIYSGDIKANADEVWMDAEQDIYPVGYAELVGLSTYNTTKAVY